MRIANGLLCLILSTGAFACTGPAPTPEDACPPSIAGDVEPQPTIHWGDREKPAVSATITNLAVECIPEPRPPVTTGKVDVPADTSYQIATTATIAITVGDSAAYRHTMSEGPDLKDFVVLEAISSNGVVLGSSREEFRVQNGARSATVSATIYGLSRERVVRIYKVTAKWCICRIY